MAKRDRHRELTYLAMMTHQHETESPDIVSEKKSKSRDHSSSSRMGRRATMDQYEPSVRTKNITLPQSVEISTIDAEDNNYQIRKIDSLDHASSNRMGRKTKTTAQPWTIMNHLPGLRALISP